MNIPLNLAIERLLEHTPIPERAETLSLLDTLGRISFKDLNALVDVPPFDSSPLDGFAIRHLDLAGAGRDKPALLRVVETLYAGDSPVKPLAQGECARIMTGAPIPAGATCVVRHEDTDNGKEYVQVPLVLREHQNYRFQGEDLRKGQELLKKGETISAAHIGVLASQGLTEASVFVRPRVGILSTGSELITGNQPLRAGKIYDSNRYMLGAKVSVLGGEPVFGANAADDPSVIAETLEELLKTCDCIVTTGGVSVGDHDYMPLAGEIIRAGRLFRGVQMKPGGWITGLYRDSKIILCLSGNPGAAAISFDLLAGPVIRRLSGANRFFPQRMYCMLQEPFPKTSDTRRFLYARREGDSVIPCSSGSGSLFLVVGCNCILDIPGGTPPLSVGDKVEVILL